MIKKCSISELVDCLGNFHDSGINSIEIGNTQHKIDNELLQTYLMMDIEYCGCWLKHKKKIIDETFHDDIKIYIEAEELSGGVHLKEGSMEIFWLEKSGEDINILIRDLPFANHERCLRIIRPEYAIIEANDNNKIWDENIWSDENREIFIECGKDKDENEFFLWFWIDNNIYYYIMNNANEYKELKEMIGKYYPHFHSSESLTYMTSEEKEILRYD